MISVLDLFSGIGGFSLGLERTGGFRTVAFCEIDPYCRRVLAKHWPGVPIYHDIRELSAGRLHADGIAVDVLCGGFPCQDISIAGKFAGIDGERSGLWAELYRLVREIRPQYLLVENVGALAFRGLGRVLGDLAALGMDAEWYRIPACAVGAPHRRERIWIVADTHHVGCGSAPLRYNALRQHERLFSPAFRIPEPPESPVCRVDDGLPNRVDRLRGLGNAVVPQIPEIIGRAILDSMQLETTDAAE